MKLFTMAIVGFVFIGMTVLALANPSMLPKHPGYPSGGEFANDTGQKNLTYNQSIAAAAMSGDTNMSPTLMDQTTVEQNNATVSERGGAAQSPAVGPKAKTEPSVKHTERKSK
ncbi:MAG TPA: hypothetical protein VFS39_03315 [Nitrospira sp.]|nr:hypothetical protein [Nitrospira sp.]